MHFLKSDVMDYKLYLVIILFIKQILTEQCYTPEKQEGQCVPLHACRKLFEAFGNPPKGSETYLRQFVCKDEQGIKVCCANSTNFLVMAEQHSIYNSVDPSSLILVKDALPRASILALPNCDAEDISDFVLPVIVAQNRDSDVEYAKCFGALINRKYVVTVSECVVEHNRKQEYSIVGVRFPTQKKNNYFYYIEEIIPHPFYDPVTGLNNLALLKLNASVTETDVASTCIYRGRDFYNIANKKVQFFTYGPLDASAAEQWRKKSSISTTYLPTNTCSTVLQQNDRPAVVTDYDWCTEGFKNSTEITCSRYIGEPLFYDLDFNVTSTKWLKGISTSRTVCVDGRPNVYVNLNSYIPWLFDNMQPWFDDNEECNTPNGEPSKCRSIFYCPTLLEMFSNTRNDSEAYLRNFICKQKRYGGDISVCCPISPNPSTIEKKNDIEIIDIPPQFLEASLCGMQHRDDYFSSSTDIAIDEHPWLVSVRGNSNYSYITCTGMLINARYILTTASCAVRCEMKTIVRLGDYNRLNDTSCVKDVDVGETDCTETEFVGIEEIRMHPFYIATFNFNNVGLLRLNKRVSYTDYIRPICLPVRGTVTAKSGDIMYRATWSFDFNRTQIGIKKKLVTRLTSNNNCLRKIRKISFTDFISVGGMCTIDFLNDTGLIILFDKDGALLFQNNYRWHIEGLINNPKIDRALPIHYTNVSKYVNWILDNMRSW